MRVVQKTGGESGVKGHNFEFLPENFPNLGHWEWYTPTKQDVVLKVLTENKVFYVSKRALCAGTTCNKALK